MKSTFEKKSTTAEFKIALNAEEWEKEIESAYQRNKKRYKVPGFRPGHAPRRYIEMHYGAGVFFDAAVDGCINRVYSEQIAAHPELDVFGSPDVAFDKPEDGDAFAFTITTTLYPEVKLGEYKGIKLPKIEYNVSDDEVNAQIDGELHHAARLVAVDRAAKEGDVTLIDYVGTVDGVEFAGGKANDHELKLGSHTFIPGFEEGLVGVKAGEERDVNVKFPDEYHAEELKGKNAVFHVTCKEVREEEIPALDDEFVKEHTKYETVDAYKAGLKETLEKRAKERERSERVDAAMKAIADKSTCEIAEKIVKSEVDRMYHEMEHNLSHYGMNVEDYLKYSNSSPAQFREERKPQAELNVKMRQIMKAIIAAEKIEATEADVDELLKDEQLRHGLEHEAAHHGGDIREFAKSDILTDKFFDFLLEHNEFVLDPEQKKEEGKTEEKKPAAKKPAAAKTTSTAAKKPAAKKPAAKKTEE